MISAEQGGPHGCSGDVGPPRVLHVVEGLHRGAIERWLIQMLSQAAERGVRLDWTFYCRLSTIGELEQRARELGAKVVHSSEPLSKTFLFMRALRRELRDGKYDVLHSHDDLLSGLYLIASAGLPVGGKIVHLHNASPSLPTENRIKLAVMEPFLRQACLRLASKIVGVSSVALAAFSQNTPSSQSKCVVHYCGVDHRPFELAHEHRERVRSNLNINPRSKLVLFAARMVPEKNPLFALDVVRELRKRDPSVIALFAGDGPLFQKVEAEAEQLRAEGALHLLGWRNDVHALMCASDLFLHTGPEKPMEGFGLAVLEAQLAGLKLLISMGVPPDAVLEGAVVSQLNVAAGALVWAQAAAELLDRDRINPQSVSATLQAAQKDVCSTFDALTLLHRSELGKQAGNAIEREIEDAMEVS